jgi:acetyl esterase/lipase
MANGISRVVLALAAGALLFGAAGASAQTAPGSWVQGIKPMATPQEPAAVALPVANPRGDNLPEAWAQQTPQERIAYNISKPVLIPVPETMTGEANAPAIILVPGGGFEFLAMDNEGYSVAKRLAPLGVRVFILKYRTLPYAGGFEAFRAALVDTFEKGKTGEILQDVPYATADAQAAIRMVRGKAAQWHVDPARVGVLGFSAGAITVVSTVQANAADAMPDFVGSIYGPVSGVKWPEKGPPLFAALAANDRFFPSTRLDLIESIRKAGGSVEFHLYSAGGHGFASHPSGASSDAWFDELVLWLKAQKIVAGQ